MRSRLRRTAFALGAILFGITMSSCNDALEGFNAETGSSIKLPSVPSVATNSDVFILTTAQVTSSKGDPANGIQIQLLCTNCDFFDAAAGQSQVIADPSVLQSVSNPYIVKTDDRGLRQFVVRVHSPSTLGVESYTATVFADIGVAAATLSVSVSPLQ